MDQQREVAASIFKINLRVRQAAFVPLVIVAALLTIVRPAHAQTLTVLHSFTGPRDGAHPLAALAIDRSGTLYGVAIGGGYEEGSCIPYGCGTAFRLVKHGSNWVFTPLYSFRGPPDGNLPAGVVIGANGALYGTTAGGGTGGNGQGSCDHDLNGCGTVFEITPPPTFCRDVLCPWNERVLHRFTGTNGDGGYPVNGELSFDNTGSLYGTTQLGGQHDYGTVYKLSASQGGWTETVLYSFAGFGPQGYGNPQSGVILDRAGNLYGTTFLENQCAAGVAYQLTNSGAGWTATVLHAFHCDSEGCGSQGGLIFDAAGNLYGGTIGSGSHGGGTVYELLASQGWLLTTLYNLTGPSGGGPADRLAMDGAGNLYGTTIADGAYSFGSVFKLSPSSGGWVYADLHDFTGGTDGAYPQGGVVLDASGNIYGTTEAGGNLMTCVGVLQSGCGVVWEITP